jgi:hypothetical protein
MPILGNEMKRRKGAVKGRECRNHSLNTKLTATEAAAVMPLRVRRKSRW